MLLLLVHRIVLDASANDGGTSAAVDATGCRLRREAAAPSIGSAAGRAAPAVGRHHFVVVPPWVALAAAAVLADRVRRSPLAVLRSKRRLARGFVQRGVRMLLLLLLLLLLLRVAKKPEGHQQALRHVNHGLVAVAVTIPVAGCMI